MMDDEREQEQSERRKGIKTGPITDPQRLANMQKAAQERGAKKIIQKCVDCGCEYEACFIRRNVQIRCPECAAKYKKQKKAMQRKQKRANKEIQLIQEFTRLQISNKTNKEIMNELNISAFQLRKLKRKLGQ